MKLAQMTAAVASSLGFAGSALAQSATQYGYDTGFFRPGPDVSLTSPRAVPLQSGQPIAPPVPQYTTIQAAVPVNTTQTVAAPVAAVVPAPAAVVTPATGAVPTPTPAPLVAPTPAAIQNWAERQADRSEEEAARQRARVQAAPAGINGAFDGTTNAENR